MKIRDLCEVTNEGEESDSGKEKMSAEFSIFSTILADIEEDPTILQKQKSLSAEFSIFSTILADPDDEDPAVLQNTNKKLTKTRRRRSMKKTPIDFTCTLSQTLTHSDLVDSLNEELKILRSEVEIKGQTCDRFLSCNPDYDRECDCVEEGKVKQLEEVRVLVDEVIKWLLRDEIESEISIDGEDSVCKVEDGHTFGTLDEILSTMRGDEDEQVKNIKRCGWVEEFIDEMLEEVKRDGRYRDCIEDTYVFGGLLENLLRARLGEKAVKEEKDISLWISNGEPEIDTGAIEEKKKVKRDRKEKKMKKLTPMVIKMERTEQESTVTKRDYFGFKRRLYLIEKLRERHDGLMKRKRKAVRFGVELSFLVAEFMLLTPNVILAGETKDNSTCAKLFGVNEDDKSTSVIIGKLEAVFGIVIWKKQNKEHDVNLPESIFRYDYFIRLCANATRVLGKIVWAMKRNHCERLKLSDLDSLFEDFQKVLIKIELKLTEMKRTEMKQRVYRSVSADYESFLKSERSDRFGRSVIGSYIVDIWKSLFQTDASTEKEVIVI